MKSAPHILVIDDENYICESCDRIFSNAGYKVDTNISATKGFRQALTNPYDAIILDLNLIESDGIKLLYGIRKRKPDVPVVIITGYPSEDTRQMSSTLGVTDYITKPFGPSEILEPVKRMVYGTDDTATVESKDLAEEEISERIYHYFLSSWFYELSNGLIRIGGYLPDLANNYIKSIKLPEPGNNVYRGLPLAEVALSNETRKIIPSPVSGTVTVVNGQLREHFYNLERNIHTKSWIAVVEPFQLEQDLQAGETRSILVFAKSNIEENEFFMRFKKKGYFTRISSNIEEVYQILDEDNIQVLLLDARKFGSSGPEYVNKINQKYPEVKIIVFNEPNMNSERQYRKGNIFYYGVDPISNNEMVDLLHCVFKDEQTVNLVNPKVSRFLPDAVGKIAITNRHGMKVTLFACDGILQHRQGIGYLITKELMDMELPVWVHHTRSPKSAREIAENQTIAKEKETSDRIIILQAKEMGLIPGSVIKNMAEYQNDSSEINALINICIQPGYGKAGNVEFDTNTILALKEMIINEMISE
jgi:DNA-binding response OmpR family regulator